MDKTRAALIIDGPNFRGACRSAKLKLDFQKVLECLNDEYDFKVLEIYYDQAPWPEKLSSFYVAMSKIGFTLIPVPMHQYGIHSRMDGKYLKSQTDQMVTIHLMWHLINNDFDTLFFFSGDCDYRFVLQELKSAGKKIIIFSSSDSFSGALANLADEVIKIDQLPKDSLVIIPEAKILAESTSDLVT